MKKLYYIKQRFIPQLGTYFVPCGQLSKTEAKKMEKPIYGDNYMTPYKTEQEYTAAIEFLKKSGENVQ
jgi:hypothetical protein